LLLGALLCELLRLRKALRPNAAPWGAVAQLVVDKAADDEEPAADTLASPLPSLLAPPAAPRELARAHRPGLQVPMRLQMRIPRDFAGARFDIANWWASPGIEVRARKSQTLSAHPGAGRQTIDPDGGSYRSLFLHPTGTGSVVHAVPHNAAVHRILGVEGRLTDALGLLSAPVFVPCPCELAVLPRSLPLDLRSVAETRRRAPRQGAGQRPDRVPGMGDDLRELREHVPGDAFKHIAWKASAARGRLMSRSFERERTRALYVVLDTGATMRDGRPGAGPLDQALDLVHSLAEAATRSHDPFGLALVDGRVIDQRPVLEGLASLRDVDRALLDIRRAVAEDLAPMEDEVLLAAVARYLVAIERVPLPAALDDAGRIRQRQRIVMAALARLPERERLPLLRGPEPATRPELAILRRFCRAMDLALPYRSTLTPALRVAGLVAGVHAASAARKGPFAIVIASDFRKLAGVCQPLWQACARARSAGHRVLAVAVREIDDRDLLDLAQHVDDIDTARGLARADAAARQQLLDELASGCTRAGGAFLADPNPQELVALWRHG